MSRTTKTSPIPDSVKRNLREIATHTDPIDQTFHRAQQHAATSLVARLAVAATDLTNIEIHDAIDDLAQFLLRLYTSRGTSYEGEAEIRANVAYLYGVAVGSALGHIAPRLREGQAQ